MEGQREQPRQGGALRTAGMTLVVLGTLLGVAVFVVLALLSPILAALVLLVGVGVALLRRRGRARSS